MTRICAHCGTEVEGEALFCPTCGQPLDAGAEPELPPAPDWPELPPRPAPEPPGDVEAGNAEAGAAPAADAADVLRVDAPPPPDEPPSEPEPSPSGAADEESGSTGEAFATQPDTVTHAWERPVSEQPVPPWRRGAAFRSGEGVAARSGEPSDAAREPAAGVPEERGVPNDAVPGGQPPVPPGRPASPPSDLAGVVRMPTLLSDWCAGIGALLALVAMFLPWRVAGAYTTGWGLASGVNVLYTIVVLAVLAIVFLPDLLPRIPQRALVLLSVGLVGTGIGLDRLGQPLTGAGGILFLIAALGVATGGLIAQLGQDRPVGGPQA